MEFAIAQKIAEWMVTGAFEKSGADLGKILINTIRERVKKIGRQGTLDDFLNEKTEENKSEFQGLIAKQMKYDQAFAEQVKNLTTQLQAILEKTDSSGNTNIQQGNNSNNLQNNAPIHNSSNVGNQHNNTNQPKENEKPSEEDTKKRTKDG